ncbi:hypothetical protein [Pseudomonas sp. HLT2-19-2]
MGEGDPMLTPSDPLSAGRSEVDAMIEKRIEELPDKEGERALDDNADAGLNRSRAMGRRLMAQ